MKIILSKAFLCIVFVTVIASAAHTLLKYKYALLALLYSSPIFTWCCFNKHDLAQVPDQLHSRQNGNLKEIGTNWRVTIILTFQTGGYYNLSFAVHKWDPFKNQTLCPCLYITFIWIQRVPNLKTRKIFGWGHHRFTHRVKSGESSPPMASMKPTCHFFPPSWAVEGLT